MPERAEFPIEGYEQIERVEGQCALPYVIGHYQTPEVYVLGLMDVTDPETWRGGDSKVLLQFLITPEEFSWLHKDLPRLNHLAEQLQEHLPRSRYFTGRTEGGLAKNCRDLLRENKLEQDEKFEAWRKRRPFQPVLRQHTHLNEALAELAELQRLPKLTESLRQEELRRQRTLGYHLRQAEAVYVAMDRCSPQEMWPGADHDRGNGFLFTTLETAQTACDYYEFEQSHHYRPQLLLQKDFPRFFQNCEMQGIHSFVVDDGVESVRIAREYIFPNTELTWLEQKNQGIRCAKLHHASLTKERKLYIDEQPEELRRSLQLQSDRWERAMMARLSRSVVYVPIDLPPDVYQQLQDCYVFTQKAAEWLGEALEREHRPSSALIPPDFMGRSAVIQAHEKGNIEKEGPLPLRWVFLGEEGHRWILAFTSERLCRTYMEAHPHRTSIMALAAWAEIADQTREDMGVLLDGNGLSARLNHQAIHGDWCSREKPAVPAPETARPEQKEAQREEQAAEEEEPQDKPKDSPAGNVFGKMLRWVRKKFG